MPLTKLQFKPVLIEKQRPTRMRAVGLMWIRCGFAFGMPEKIGGWESSQGSRTLELPGRCTLGWLWTTVVYIGIGTSLKYYLNQDGGFLTTLLQSRYNCGGGCNLSLRQTGHQQLL